jgi:hypothetical protein
MIIAIMHHVTHREIKLTKNQEIKVFKKPFHRTSINRNSEAIRNLLFNPLLTILKIVMNMKDKIQFFLLS